AAAQEKLTWSVSTVCVLSRTLKLTWACVVAPVRVTVLITMVWCASTTRSLLVPGLAELDWIRCAGREYGLVAVYLTVLVAQSVVLRCTLTRHVPGSTVTVITPCTDKTKSE